MRVLKEEVEVEDRLNYFNVTKADLLEIVRAAAGAKRNATPNQPLSAGGQFAYLYGTGRLRDIFVGKGWEICRSENIESVFHPTLGLKVIYQNADRAGELIFDPLASSKKGPAAARSVEMGQGEFWPELREAELKEINAANWYLFVRVDGENVSAELSFPKAIEGDQFCGFHERILIVEKGDWLGIDTTPDEQPLPDFNINISRKE